jgi:hypothetical protein
MTLEGYSGYYVEVGIRGSYNGYGWSDVEAYMSIFDNYELISNGYINLGDAWGDEVSLGLYKDGTAWLACCYIDGEGWQNINYYDFGFDMYGYHFWVGVEGNHQPNDDENSLINYVDYLQWVNAYQYYGSWTPTTIYDSDWDVSVLGSTGWFAGWVDY